MGKVMSKLMLKVELDGKTMFVPLQDAAQYAAMDGAVLTIVDADTKEVAENVETERQGDDLVVVADGAPATVIDGFYAEGSDLTFVSAEGAVASHDAVWTLSTAGAAVAAAAAPGVSAGVALAGLAGIAAVAAVASGGSDDAGVAQITFSMDTNLEHSTRGQWLSSEAENFVIDANTSYEIVVIIPDFNSMIAVIQSGMPLQDSGDAIGGLISQGWNLGADDKVIFMLPDTAEGWDLTSGAGGSVHVGSLSRYAYATMDNPTNNSRYALAFSYSATNGGQDAGSIYFYFYMDGEGGRTLRPMVFTTAQNPYTLQAALTNVQLQHSVQFYAA